MNFAVLMNHYREGRPDRTLGGLLVALHRQWHRERLRRPVGRPAGKYDAARGLRDGAQAWEVSMHGAKMKGAQGWWGPCNGWCAAAALYPKPREAKRSTLSRAKRRR
jgi:hypothetical protein